MLTGARRAVKRIRAFEIFDCGSAMRGAGLPLCDLKPQIQRRERAAGGARLQLPQSAGWRTALPSVDAAGDEKRGEADEHPGYGVGGVVVATINRCQRDTPGQDQEEQPYAGQVGANRERGGGHRRDVGAGEEARPNGVAPQDPVVQPAQQRGHAGSGKVVEQLARRCERKESEKHEATERRQERGGPEMVDGQSVAALYERRVWGMFRDRCDSG